MRIRSSVFSMIPLLGLAAGLPAHAADVSDDPVAVVQAFNQAIGARELNTMLGLIAEGAVQYALRAPHAGMPPPASLTSDLAAHWQMIGPVVFAVTGTYERTAEVLQTHVEPEIATVWTKVVTRTVDRNGAERTHGFSEVYLLVNKGDGWKIGGIADSRSTDQLAIGN